MRGWINSNRGNGNVLRMNAKELTDSDQTVRPNANSTTYRILDANGAIALTIDGSDSLPADEINILVQATSAVTLVIDGDAAAGTLAIGAGGVGAVKLINGGTNNAPFFLSYVGLS